MIERGSRTDADSVAPILLAIIAGLVIVLIAVTLDSGDPCRARGGDPIAFGSGQVCIERSIIR